MAYRKSNVPCLHVLFVVSLSLAVSSRLSATS